MRPASGRCATTARVCFLPCERKSVEPIAAATAPERVGAQHQALLHFVAEGAWSDEVVLAKVRAMVLPKIERHGPIEACIIDDTSFPKHGSHSVGVTLQYCGELGKQENCQVAVSPSVANHHASLPVAYRLYLPKSWAQDSKRRKKAGVPDEIDFQTKPKMALDQLGRCLPATRFRRRQRMFLGRRAEIAALAVLRACLSHAQLAQADPHNYASIPTDSGGVWARHSRKTRPRRRRGLAVANRRHSVGGAPPQCRPAPSSQP